MIPDKLRYFFPKLKNRFALEKNRLWQHVNVECVASRGFVPFKGKEAFAERLMRILGNFNKGLLEGISNSDQDIIIVSANQAVHHEFDLLGSGPVHLEPIDWHVDFKSGERWKKVYYREMCFIKGADIKVPWELSRCQHLLWLGEAFMLTGEKSYAQEVIDEINWWIDDNPLMYSVNWKCAMDVAFRAVNWMFALNMIADYEGFDDAFALKTSKSLWQHAFFIRNNLEKVIPDSNNHYTSDLVGLLYIGVLFSYTRKGKRWKRFAYNELIHETMSQVLDSGVHYERTVSYHRMMTEMLSYPVYMLNRIGESVPEAVCDRLRAMYAYIANYTKPNGYSPLIGDNDDGRFVPFLMRDFREHNYLNDPDSVENRVISAGMKPLFCSTKKENHLYEDAGVAIAHKGNSFLFVNNGGYSKRPSEQQIRIGTHTHNDLLSFELALNGKDIIVDAGTYLYTSSKVDRDAFRSSVKHNSVVVDDEEQNEPYTSFEVKRNVKVGCLKQIGDCSFSGEYYTIKKKLHHQRVFELTNEGLTITDSLAKVGRGHMAKLFFHLAKDTTSEIRDGKVLINNDSYISFNHQPENFEILADTLSPTYGVLTSSQTVVASFGFENELKIRTTINQHG